MRKTVIREVEVIYCDFCDKEVQFLDKCIICDKGGCSYGKHWRFSLILSTLGKGKVDGLICTECAKKPIMLEELVKKQLGND